MISYLELSWELYLLFCCMMIDDLRFLFSTSAKSETWNVQICKNKIKIKKWNGWNFNKLAFVQNDASEVGSVGYVGQFPFASLIRKQSHSYHKISYFEMDHPDSIRNDTDSKTLSRLVMVRTKDPELVILLNAIQTACKLISRSVRKAGIAGLCMY